MSEIKRPDFMPGDLVYLKDSLRSDNTRMTRNGKEVDRILLQDSYTVLNSVIEWNTASGEPIYMYYIRPRYFTTLENRTASIACRSFEVCGRAEAGVILKLIDSRNEG